MAKAIQSDSPPKFLNWPAVIKLALATAVAGLVGWFLALGVALVSLGIGLLVAGAIWGYCTGWAQKYILCRSEPSRRWTNCWERWESASGAGGAIGWLLVAGAFGQATLMQPDDPHARFGPLFIPVAFFIGGTGLGFVQWAAMGSAFRRAMQTVWWVVANACIGSLSAYIGLNVLGPLLPKVPDGGHLYGPGDVINQFVAGGVCIVLFSALIAIPTATLFQQTGLYSLPSEQQ